ncbi:hypothetical protein AtubIFM56815_003592 [Aspergillus tubingensis]|uniref:Uncharacterized protein n=1 Tax=Aspergillus tubingensis TaxID=5068 RepID=A0A9W6AZG4_ASPTU|nr:hypothetical protein AtubIFM54640_004400 [Aspergillus tubingensis]GLA89120.1 hypothetical protein AtubIFM56815_003592 [Aspergillus tubingensis]GLB22844.1 hypothetical protein AtubIFM61612_003423 [Aspergillus tubingensis]
MNNLAVIPAIPILLTIIIAILVIPMLIIAAIPTGIFLFCVAVCGVIAVVVFALFSMFFISPVILVVAAITWFFVLTYRACRFAFTVLFGLLVNRLWPPGPLPNGWAN